MFNIGDIVIYNDENIMITNLYDGKFDGVSITTGDIIKESEIEKCNKANVDFHIKVVKRANEQYIYDVYINNGFKCCGLASDLIRYIPKLIKNIYADVYK